MKKGWETIYKNGARIQVDIQEPPKNWRSVEPRDVIRLTIRNKQYLGRKMETMIMRPDEAHELINLLNKALQHLTTNSKI